MYNFKNTILIIVFNYSNCICNKNIIKNLYEKYFKTIIFYSDYPIIQEEDDVNFIKIGRGFFLTKVFSNFYIRYNSIIDY